MRGSPYYKVVMTCVVGKIFFAEEGVCGSAVTPFIENLLVSD